MCARKSRRGGNACRSRDRRRCRRCRLEEPEPLREIGSDDCRRRPLAHCGLKSIQIGMKVVN